MRSNKLLLLICAIALSFYTVAAAPQLQLNLRQDDDKSDNTALSSSASSRPSSTVREDLSTTQSGRKETGSATPVTSASSSVSVTTSTSNAPSATASNSPVADPSHDLPLKPKITPALGLAGIIFILSGAVYTVIGIKSKWLYVFTSAAYLTSLSVTVLIVYLMSPPVSSAVQGAFFVAACLSGLIFGALSLIFADITEGLGCLLGGFCLSMWLLTLKEGGLIQSSSGRAILIGCLSFAAFGLSWSRHTREYGLIVCISFAGGTITVLGIDCFSRAGLKEFWLYIWNLNPDAFPLFTDTYPINRGMKAEQAAMIIFAVFGVISQLRVWKLVKEHRAASTNQRLERARDQELEEEERGRKIVDAIQEERAQWEATYDPKKSQESSSEATVQDEKSVHVKHEEVHAEHDGLAQPLNKEAVVSVAGVGEDEIEKIDPTGKPLPQQPVQAHQPSGKTSNVGSVRASLEVTASGQMPQAVLPANSLQPSAPPPPVIIPLPFKVPQEEDAKSQVSDNASISAVPDVEDDVQSNRVSFSRRISGVQRLPKNQLSSIGLQSEKAVCDDDAEDDRASSVAATLDDNVSTRELSRPSSLVPAQSTEKVEDEANATHSGDDANEEPSSSNVKAPRQSLTISTDPKPTEPRSKRSSLQTPAPNTDAGVLQKQVVDGENSQESAAPSTNAHVEPIDSATASFENLLPSEFSKVAHAFRVNEWSKHLEVAEKPDVEEIQEPGSPGVQVDHERPAPVSEELTNPLHLQRRNSNRLSSTGTAQYDNAFVRSNSNVSQYSRAKSPAMITPSNPITGGEMSRSGSQALIRPSRNSSSQLAPLAVPGNARVSPAPISPLPSNTLMGQREKLMRNRTSSQSFAPMSPSPSPNHMITNEEDMTLAQRKRTLQHQKPPQASQKWNKNSRQVSNQMQVTGFDSHPPQRNRNSLSDQKRESLLAGWRETIRQDQQQSSRQVVVGGSGIEEQQRAALLNAKRQKEMEKQQQAARAQQRESMMHNMMRSNEMLDAHREAMRRMQKAANKNA